MRSLALLVVSALLAAQDGSALLGSGVQKFFGGDLAGAAGDWASAHAGGQPEAGELAVLSLTILCKDALRRGDQASALRHGAHALEVAPQDAGLKALHALAERARGRKKEIDSSAEQDRLVARVLKLDLTTPQLAPGPEPRAGSGSDTLLRQMLEDDKTFDLPRLLKAVREDEETMRAADQAKLSRAWRRRRARYSYEQGLPAYYAGDFEAAEGLFRQALELDSGLEPARTGLKGCAAALRK